MAGYSGTPLAKKLGIKPGDAVGVFSAPPNFVDLLRPNPGEVTLVSEPEQACDVLVVFATDLPALRRRLARALRFLPAVGGLWIAWPKRSSGVDTDLSFGIVQPVGLDSGLVDNKVCAIDETWSGLRFVVRTKDRADWPR